MEIRISITDAGAAGSSAKTIQVSGDSGAASGGVVSGGGVSGGGVSGGGAPGGASPQESNAAQESHGGIDAGSAPAMGAFYQAGVPQAFVAQRAANVVPNPSVGTKSTDESGGAAPGSGSGMEASTGEVQHG